MRFALLPASLPATLGWVVRRSVAQAWPDLALTVIVTDADGNQKTFDSNAAHPGDIPQGIQFSTQQGSGFYTAGFTLSCPLDLEREDIHLFDEVLILWADGDTAYEGFVAAMPRSTDGEGQGTLTITCAGWIASASDESFTAIFIDRDVSAWGSTSRTQQLANITAGHGNTDASQVRDQSGAAAMKTAVTGAWDTGGFPISEALYDAGPGNSIGVLFGDWVRSATIDGSDTAWTWIAKLLTSDNIASGEDSTADLRGTSPTSTFAVTATAARRFALVRLYYSAAGGDPGTEYAIDWINLAVVGDHGLELIGTPSLGVAASDVFRYLIANHCPLLNADGVQDTTYPIEQLAFRDDTKPYDGFLKVNNFHLWWFGVWEGRTMHFEPTDLTDWDWEIRHDEAGNTIGLQGDEYTDLRNHIRVQFTNVATGAVELLTAADYPELRDDSISNPLNQHGRERSGEPFSIPFPTTLGNALELGRMRMLEDNQPKAPGSFTATPFLRDRAGMLQPAGKVRAGHRIRLTSSVNLSDRPRLIHETSYSDDGKSVTIAVDGTRRVLDAYVDRVTTTLAAAGLS